MGLFDMFGAGGGSVVIQPQSAVVSAGQMLAGQVIFNGGSRGQQITKITLKLTMETRSMRMTPQGPQPHTESRDVVPETVVSGPTQSQPGQAMAFPFNFSIPPGMPNTTPQQVSYHLRANADIPGEVDSGKSMEIQIVGGAQPQPQMMGGMPGQPGMMQPGMMAGGMMAGGMMQPGMQQPGMPMQQPGMMPMQQAPMQIGTPVQGQWQDGNWYPGRIVAMQNGMIGVDWDNPQMGASSWLQPMQVRAGGMQQPMMGQPMGGMPAKGMDPMHKGMDAKGMDPMHQKGMDPMHQKGMDPMHQKGMDPMHQKGMDPHKGNHMGQAQFGIGMHVNAQHPNGQWYPGTVVAMQNGMVGVDWTDPKLGASAWVQPHQVRGGK